MANVTLFQWGLIAFQIQPLNIHAYDHFTGTDFAKKDVMESIPRREYVGEKDEKVNLRGGIFPLAIGGFANLEAFDNARREGQSHLLVRGGGSYMQTIGWFVCEDLRRGHEYLAPNGVGKVVNFEAEFSRVDQPRAATYYNDIWKMTQST